jgi:hypothetical protein
MKRIVLSLATLALFVAASSAQAQTIKTKVKTKPATGAATKTTTVDKTTATSATPATNLQDYAGSYAVENLPFEEMSFFVKDGQLNVKAGDNEGPLRVGKTPDTFDSDQAVMHFQRDATNKVVSMEMEAAGMTFSGTKK